MTSDLTIPGEPVWTGDRRKRISLVMESAVLAEEADLGEADRPSEVARLLRQAADEIVATVREGLAATGRHAGEKTGDQP